MAELASQLKTNTRMLAVSLSGPIVGFRPYHDDGDTDNADADADADDDDDEGDGDGAAVAAAPLVQMLRTYNYTLQKLAFVERRGHGARTGVGRNRGCGPGVACVWWDFFDPYLRRNHRIRQALKVWEPAAYRVHPVSVWPCAFEMVSDVPTLLLRLLRRGNVKALGQVVVGGDRATNRTKKRRARGSGAAAAAPVGGSSTHANKQKKPLPQDGRGARPRRLVLLLQHGA
jgi:hypothetical protein